MHGGRGPGGHMMGTKPVKAKNTKGTIIRMFSYLKHVKVELIFSLVALVIATVANLVVPKFTGNAIQNIIDKDYRGLVTTIVIILIAYLINVGFSFVQGFLMVNVSNKTVRAMRTDLFEKLQKLPLKFFDSKTHGELMSRLSNDVDNVSNMLGQSLTQVFSNALSLVGSLAMMIYLSPLLTILTLIAVPAGMFVVTRIAKYTRKLFKEQQAALGKLNGFVEETVTGAKVVKVFGRENYVLDTFEETNQALTKVGIRATTISSIIMPLMNTMNNISFALAAGVGGFMAVRGMIPIAFIQSFLQYSKQFSRPINEIANQFSALQSALAGAERVFEVMDTPPEPADDANAIEFKNPKGDVLFDNVTFGYTPEKKILNNVTIRAKAGETIALVGPTGAGKTTVVNLLMRFYDMENGNIFIDGHNIKEAKRQSLRDSLGMVLQDVYLFADTIRENIRYGKLTATDAEVVHAAKLANADHFITRMHGGYDALLTEDGSNLSQGQRQLLSIARAILADPSILILDEATSSVDTRTEMNIQAAMLALMKGRTSFVIAHRLSTIRNADQILVINDGRIIEQGKHEELLKNNGYYANLYNSQFRRQIAAETATEESATA